MPKFVFVVGNPSSSYTIQIVKRLSAKGYFVCNASRIINLKSHESHSKKNFFPFALQRLLDSPEYKAVESDKALLLTKLLSHILYKIKVRLGLTTRSGSVIGNTMPNTFLGYFNYTHPDELLNFVSNLFPDAPCLLGSSHILSSHELAAFRYVLNCHPGDLPKYKGSCAIFRAFQSLEVPALSCHFATDKVDSGSVIARQEIPPLPGECWNSYIERLGTESARFLVDSFDSYENHRLSIDRDNDDHSCAFRWKDCGPSIQRSGYEGFKYLRSRLNP